MENAIEDVDGGAFALQAYRWEDNNCGPTAWLVMIEWPPAGLPRRLAHGAAARAHRQADGAALRRSPASRAAES